MMFSNLRIISNLIKLLNKLSQKIIKFIGLHIELYHHINLPLYSNGMDFQDTVNIKELYLTINLHCEGCIFKNRLRLNYDD